MERKKNNWKRNIMIAFHVLALTVVLGTVATLAWLVIGRRFSTSKVRMAAVGENYEISVLENGGNGNYYNLHEDVIDPYAIVWTMDATNNMDNYGTPVSNGIHPGSQGEIEFFVKAKKPSVELKFSFDIVGYESVTTKNASNETVETLTLLNGNTVPALFLNGHVLLFRERSGLEGNYTYSDPILPNNDKLRVVTDEYSEADGKVTEKIYWVWPMTLSTLVDASSNEAVTTEPFTDVNGASYGLIVSNILDYPQYYMKSREQSGDDFSGLTVGDIVNKYQIYGDLYDRADNDIGMEINYIVLKMSVEEVIP